MPLDDGFNPGKVLGHYGYDASAARSGSVMLGFWQNDEVMKKLALLPELLEKHRSSNGKVRITFDYDPEFPRALVQVWGL